MLMYTYTNYCNHTKNGTFSKVFIHGFLIGIVLYLFVLPITLVNASVLQHANDVSFSEFLSQYESGSENVSDAVVQTTTQTAPQQSFSEFVASYNEGGDMQSEVESAEVATMHGNDNQDFFQFVSQYGTSSVTEDNDIIRASSVEYVDTVSPALSSRHMQSSSYNQIHTEEINIESMNEPPTHLFPTQRNNDNIVLRLSAILAIILLIIYSVMKIIQFILKKQLTQTETKVTQTINTTQNNS